ncbi:hypothetical protein [Trueperella sp. LYQ143]|uniref:hypothetical protein n=1 Tax=unclassified Trueperella TaxID=2630174 RepID=UPI0039830B97
MDRHEFVELSNRLRIPGRGIDQALSESSGFTEGWHLVTKEQHGAPVVVVGYAERGYLYDEKRFADSRDAYEYLWNKICSGYGICDELRRKVRAQYAAGIPDDPSQDIQHYDIPVIIAGHVETWHIEWNPGWNPNDRDFTQACMVLRDPAGQHTYSSQTESLARCCQMWRQKESNVFIHLCAIREQAEKDGIKLAVAGAFVHAVADYPSYPITQPYVRVSLPEGNTQITLDRRTYQRTKGWYSAAKVPIFAPIEPDRAVSVVAQYRADNEYRQARQARYETRVVERKALERRRYLRVELPLTLLTMVITTVASLWMWTTGQAMSGVPKQLMLYLGFAMWGLIYLPHVLLRARWRRLDQE